MLKVISLILLLTFTAYAKYNSSLRVTASAYSSSTKETNRNPFLGAWGNRLNPKIKSIAVSRDLIKMGLKNGMRVKIKGYKGTFLVLDKMNKRWRKKIDIYMGTNRKKALKFGKKRLTIYWNKPKRK